MSQVVKINVISDTICPFCYLGYKKLNKAQELIKAKFPATEFKLKFSAYQLDPTLPLDHPINKRERYAKKFGKERVQVMEQGMIERGKPYDINFSYGGSVRQTTDSHRLLNKAYKTGGQALQTAVLERLFKGYFEQEKDIGDVDFLATEASAAGLGSKEEILSYLSSDADKADVKAEILNAQQLGVQGVPFSIINDKYAISGAQEPEVFAEVIERIIKGEPVA